MIHVGARTLPESGDLTQPALTRGRSRLRLLRGLLSLNPVRRGMTLVLLGCRMLGWNVLITNDDTVTGLVMGDRYFLRRFGEIDEKPKETAHDHAR